ncbi:MAG TPA: histidine kinase dimerization/phospho-acceptor domain-containing protein [Methylomirabilota bacterium]|nr:histidine kinase dimerization/phospho-acceptor domain-containing protein [Methylomirabilota bacterium]
MTGLRNGLSPVLPGHANGRSFLEHALIAMNQAPYLKQTILFLLAVVLPSSALVLLSLRMLGQERELAEKRSAERRELLGRQFGESLSARLREVADRVASLDARELQAGAWKRLDADLALVAVVTQDRMILPWERHPQAEALPETVQPAPFAEALDAGHRLEFAGGDLPRALARYREATQLSGLGVQHANATLAVARVLSKMGATEEAETQLEPVLRIPLSTRDEFDVPIAFYAAGLLSREFRQLESVLSMMEDAFATPDEFSVSPVSGVSGVLDLSPAATCMARDYLEEIRTRLPARKEQIEGILNRVNAQAALQEQGELLKNDFPVVRAALIREQDGGVMARRWTLYGARPWLVSMVPLHGTDESALVGVRAGDFAKRVLDSGALVGLVDAPRLVRGPHAQGVWLGEELSDLQVILPPSAVVSRSSEPQRLYSLLIVLVVGITLFGAYLWWRDTRRELKLAEMRSDFVSSVSHELKTPLTSVRMLAETLRIRDFAPKERGEYLDLILSESERLGRAHDRILHNCRFVPFLWP